MDDIDNQRHLEAHSLVGRRTWIGLGLLTTSFVAAASLTACDLEVREEFEPEREGSGCETALVIPEPDGACDKLAVILEGTIDGWEGNLSGKYHRVQVTIEKDGETYSTPAWQQVRQHDGEHYYIQWEPEDYADPTAAGEWRLISRDSSHQAGEPWNEDFVWATHAKDGPWDSNSTLVGWHVVEGATDGIPLRVTCAHSTCDGTWDSNDAGECEVDGNGDSVIPEKPDGTAYACTDFDTTGALDGGGTRYTGGELLCHHGCGFDLRECDAPSQVDCGTSQESCADLGLDEVICCAVCDKPQCG
ncbi:MAG: hypothetical protein K0V04_03955 [Deltaproteobacteria bacterium]|nr:hypothetical protein [Deltaproteobacteria bacterium]